MHPQVLKSCVIVTALPVLLLTCSCASQPAKSLSPASGRVELVVKERVPGIGKEPSPFEHYVEEIFEVVQTRWDSLLTQSMVRPQSGSKVVVRFTLNSRGGVARIVEVAENAGKQGATLCLEALRSSEPFPPWTDKMIEAWGHEHEVTFAFFYH